MAKLTARGVSRQLRDGERQFDLMIDRFCLQPGDRKALVGPSGCGKTTAMDLLALASTPDTAFELRLDVAEEEMSVDIAAMVGKGRHGVLARLRAQHFGYVLQTASLFPFLSVGANVELAQQMAGRIDRPLIDDLLARLGLRDLRKAMPADLSVGQQQRVAIARALAHHPDFLLADEPTAALDPASARTALQLCCDIMAGNGAVLAITHDADLASDLGFEIVPLQSRSDASGTVTHIDDGSTGRRTTANGEAIAGGDT